jgi:FkbM family methyltransferase
VRVGALSIARRLVERAFGVQVIPAGQAALVFEREHLRRFLAHFEVDCVFDVGANAGQYAQMLRERVGYDGTIISYEPIPELAALLRMAAKSDPAWFIEELALGDAEGTATFNVYASDQFSSLHAFSAAGAEQFPGDGQLERCVEVRTVTLAGEIAKYRAKIGFSRPFLKMDTQGHDLAVAVGAGEELKTFVGLQSELAIVRLYAGSPTYRETLDYYASYGFTLSAFVPNNLGHFPRLLEMDCIMFRESTPSAK